MRDPHTNSAAETPEWYILHYFIIIIYAAARKSSEI